MRLLHLTTDEARRYRRDLSAEGAAFRAELAGGAQCIANAYRDIVAVVEGPFDVPAPGALLALVLPKVLEHDPEQLDGECDAGGPAAGGGN